MNVPRYAKATPDVTRGLTSDVWRQSLEKYASLDPAFGTRFSDDFVDNIVGLTGTTAVTVDSKWSARDSAAAGGTYAMANTADPDGVASIGSTGTTNHFGIDADGAAFVNLPTHSTDARGRVCWEFRFDFSTADTVFVGLSEVVANFLSATSQLPTDSDYVGFYSEDNGVSLSFVCANDNAGGTAVTDSYAIPTADLQASGQQRVAFAVNRDKSVDIAVNGVYYGKLKNGIVSTALPIETLVPRLVATAGAGTTAPVILGDHIDVFVESITT